MNRVGPPEMRAILAITDRLAIHRESIRVPLQGRGDGSIRVTDADQVEIVLPAVTDFTTWLAELEARLRQLDLARVRRSE